MAKKEAQGHSAFSVMQNHSSSEITKSNNNIEQLSRLTITLFFLLAGSDKDTIVAILGARTNKQRQEIASSYQQKYSKVKDSLQRPLASLKTPTDMFAQSLIPPSVYSLSGIPKTTWDERPLFSFRALELYVSEGKVEIQTDFCIDDCDWLVHKKDIWGSW